MQSVVITTEEQIVVEISETLELLFSTISYLRNFFPSSYFTTKNINTVEAKILIPSCYNSSLFISWYKNSVKDAFQRGYLRKLVLAVYLDDRCPEKVSETYTLEFNYEKETFGSIFQMIRTLSLLTQTLEPLPPKKYLTLKLFYNEKTPFEYEPEGFKACVEREFLFESEPLKLDLNSFKVEKGCTNAFIKTVFDKNVKILDSQRSHNTPNECSSQKTYSFPIQRGNLDNISQKLENELSLKQSKDITTCKDLDLGFESKEKNTVNSIKGNSENNTPTKISGTLDDRDVYSQRSIKEIVPSCKLLKKNTLIRKNDKIEGQVISKGPIVAKQDILKSNGKEDEVKCICNINISDSDMLYCDSCDSWLHTVCCGFFTNTDRRIPPGKYICILCSEKNPKSLHLYRNLAIFRRTLGIIYNENLESVSWLSQRLGISHNYSRNTVNRLASEGFIIKKKVKNGMSYEVVKTKETKEKIKEYFTLGLKKFKSSVPIKDVECE